MRIAMLAFVTLCLLAFPMQGYTQENPLRKHERVLNNSTSPLFSMEVYANLKGGDINEAFQQYCLDTRIQSFVFEEEDIPIANIRLARKSSIYLDEETGNEWLYEELNYLSEEKIILHSFWPNLSTIFSFTDAEWAAIALILEYNNLRSFFCQDYPFRSADGLYLSPNENDHVIDDYELGLEQDFDKYTYEGAYAKCSKVVNFKNTSTSFYRNAKSISWYPDPNDIKLNAVLLSGIDIGRGEDKSMWYVDRQGFAIFHGMVAVVFPTPWI